MEEKLKNLKENISSVANQILDKKDNNELAEKIIPTPKNPANEEILLILKYYQEGKIDLAEKLALSLHKI